MANRKMIRVPVVCSHVRDGDIAGDWVTVGVVVSKMPPKDTAKVCFASKFILSDWVNTLFTGGKILYASYIRLVLTECCSSIISIQ